MYNVGIIGCGNKGALADAPGTGNEHKYLSYAHAVKDHGAFDLVFMVDNNPAKEKEADRIWKPKLTQKTRLKLADYSIDVAIIATPDNSHYDALLKLLRVTTNLKLVICEKPLCTNSEQAKEIIEIYKYWGIPLMVDYTRRFIPDYQQMQDEIVSGKWGNFIEGYGYFNRGWLHTASHMVDFVLWMNGNLDNFKIREIKTDYRWIYQIGMFYETDFFSDHAVNFVKNPHVPSMYDNHLMYVMDNAWYFLEGADKLMCTGEDALRALEETERMMKA